MAESILRIKSKQFAIDIIHACREMRKNKVEYALIDQLLRSGTSVGANIHEAQFAQGTKDFISKLEIALKECNECDYWLDILLSTQSIGAAEFIGGTCFFIFLFFVIYQKNSSVIIYLQRHEAEKMMKGVHKMEPNKAFLNAKEIAGILRVSCSQAYTIIAELNAELESLQQ